MRKILTMALLMMLTLVLFLTVAASAATETVLYVSDAGASGNAGTSASAPLKSLSAAISKLPAAGGRIVVCGDLTITEEVPSFPAKTGKVTVTGTYGGTNYKPTIKLACTTNMFLQFQSAIEFNNLTFNRTGSGYAEFTTGPSLTIGEGVTFLSNGAAMKEGGGVMMVRLGYSDKVTSLDKKCTNAFFRMESGTVNYIQGGNKWNDVGTARIEIVGPATVTDNIQCGGTNFDVDTVELSIQGNAKIPIVYAGGYGKDSSHTGTVGTVTIGAGNSAINKLYANRSDYYTIGTKLNIVLNNTKIGGFNMGGGSIASAAKVYLTFKNQEFFTTSNILSWVDTLKVLENSTVLVNADYAGPASVAVTSGSTLYLSSALNTKSDLPSNTETSGGTIALYTGQNLPEGTPITMYYDDRLDVSKYSRVMLITKGTPTSYQVGYDISANSTKDTAVITYNSSKNQLIATGVGTAWVTLGDERIKVTVKPAPISLFLMIGQSNMAGSEGNTNQSVICPEGQVYSTMGPPSSGWASTYGLDNMETLTTANGANFVASTLAGSKSGTNRAGTTKNLSTYPINALTSPGPGKPGMDSGFAYEWNKLTGEKVWLVNAAHGGTSMGDWVAMGSTIDPDGVTGAEYKQMKGLFNAVLQTMKAEISAGHYTLSHYAYFWCQGCADRIQTTDWYLDKFGILHNRLKEDFTFNFGDGKGDRKLESANLVLVRACGTDGYSSQTDTKTKDYYTYRDLEMNGVRTAQYYMANSNESTFKDVHMVCNIGDQWVWWDTAKTKETTSTFFKERYPNGFDYKIQSGTLSLPTSPTVVKDSIHYNQVGYNEIGREAARNAVYRMYPELAPDEEVTIKLLAWDGITDLAGKTDTKVLTERQTIVPVVYPLYRSKELVLSGAMKHDFVSIKHTQVEYGYYDIPGAQKGTVTAKVGDVTVSYTLDPSAETHTYRWETKDGKLVSVTGSGLTANTLKLLNGTNSGGTLANAIFRLGNSVVLRHDQPWKIEWQGNLANASGETFFLLSSSPSSNTLDAPCIMVSTHSIIVARRLDDSKAVVNRNGAPYASNYFDHLRGNATINLSSATTTYALVNEVAADGSNMVYLYINGTKKTALNKHYGINASGVDESGVTSTWLSGKDFVFSHMGAKSSGCSNVTDVTCDPDYANFKTHYDHTLNGTLKYMQIDENRLIKTEAVAATCLTDGCKEYYTDPVTGKIYADKNGTQVTTLAALKIPAGHSMTAYTETEATCTEPGNTAYWFCQLCEGYFSDASGNTPIESGSWVIPASHNMRADYSADDTGHWYACTKCDYTEGYAVHGYNTTNCAETATCGDCGYVKAAGSHIWSAWNEVTPATCSEPGTKTRECTACGADDEEEIPAKGHELKYYPYTAPTCTTDGNDPYWWCVECGLYFSDEGVTPCEEFSWVLQGGHELTYVAANPASYTAPGNIEYWYCQTCDQCYSDGECKTPIAKADTVIPQRTAWGDANGDKQITAEDARLIKQYRAGLVEDTALELTLCDLDGNNEVDVYDAYLIQIYLAGQISKFPCEG